MPGQHPWVLMWVPGLLVDLEERFEVLRGDLQEVQDVHGDACGRV